MNKLYDILIVGSGPAGSTAAIYASRDGFKTCVLEGNMPGGLLTTTTKVENFPGFVEGIDGFELVNNMKKQAIKYGADYVSSSLKQIKKQENFMITLEDNEVIEAEAVIIASGSVPRRLNIDSETRYWSKGVHTCATCDGAFYKNKTVAVIGGGDSAMEEAHFLANFVSKLYIINRSDVLRATKVMQEKVLKNEKVNLINSANVVEFVGTEKLSSLKLVNNLNNETISLDVDGAFLAIGHIPNTDYLKELVELGPTGNIKVHNDVYTNVDGIFAAGDVVDFVYKQAISSAGMGCMAAIAARKYLHN